MEEVLPSFQGKIKARGDDPNSRHYGDIEPGRRPVVKKRDGLETGDDVSASAGAQGSNRGLDEGHEKPPDCQIDDQTSEIEIQLGHFLLL
jgi:hypothetical protein